MSLTRLTPLTVALVAWLTSCTDSGPDDSTQSPMGGTGAAPGGAMTTGGTAFGGAPQGGAGASAGSADPGGSNPLGGGAGGAGNGGISNAGVSGSGGASGAANGGAGRGGAGSGGATGGAGRGGAAGGGAGGAGNGGAGRGGGGSGGATGGAGAGGSDGTDAPCPLANATELTLVRGWLANTSAAGALPQYAYNNIGTNFPVGAARDRLACSIAMSCREFAPMETNWLRKCEALVTSAIVAESSYNPASVVNDSYSTRQVNGTTANDPTVGLLQIRFSSTVHDYNYYGPMAKMTSIGCSWPSALSSQADNATFWATAGGTTYLAFMQDVACNIGLATWYYLYNATGNGGSSAVWISDYCAGRGVAGNMVVGLISHLMGGNFTRPADANNAYPWGIECCACGNPSVCSCTGCTGRFAALMGIGTSSSRPSPDPFQESLAPEVSKYCR